MTKEEISKFVHGKDTSITYAPYKTEIIFNNEYNVLGYFNNNTPNSSLYFKNQWNFVVVSQDNKEINKTTLDGNDFVKIILHKT